MRLRLQRTRRSRSGRRGERGASSIEYALIAFFIAVVIIGSVTFFGSSTSGLFTRTCSSLPGSSSC
jgi:Flp pilus assembly pilin Flp